MRLESRGRRILPWWACGTLLAIALNGMAVRHASAQAQVLSQAGQTIQIERGETQVILLEFDAARILIGDEAIAELQTITVDGQPSPRQFLIRGIAVGSTSLIIWNQADVPEIYDVEVVVDATALQTQLQTLFPNSGITIISSGPAVIVSGTIRDPVIARRALELAEATGAQVINNLQAPPQRQIMLRVRFAEVRRTARSRLGTDLFASNVAELDEVFGDGSTGVVETLSEGMARLFLFNQDVELDVVINALKARGEFRSLAEPNLIAIEGTEASFLAGGEFPYPVVQQGGGGGAGGPVTVQFKEFGVRLTFTPTITNSGSIRLAVEPEVSQLDFANGVTFSGFQVPSLLTRRAKTEVELNPGQHLALAGLLDNSMQNQVDKIPFLGDLPIIGAFFRSTSDQQSRTELVVLVTPVILEASNTPLPIPTGEPIMWKWDRHMRIDTTATRTGGGQR
jgi:pilus assembly protein CpaC